MGVVDSIICMDTKTIVDSPVSTYFANEILRMWTK